WAVEDGLFSLRCSAADLAAGLPTPPLLGGWAWVARLVLAGLRPSDPPPGLGPFEGILCPERPSDALDPLLAPAGLGQLTGLDLTFAHLGQPPHRDPLRRLGEVPFDGLTYLALQGNDLDAAALDDLLARPVGRRLRLLNLLGNPLGDSGVAALAR